MNQLDNLINCQLDDFDCFGLVNTQREFVGFLTEINLLIRNAPQIIVGFWSFYY